MFGWSCMTAADTKSSKASPNRLGQKQHVSRAKCRQSIALDAGTAASVMRKADGMIMDNSTSCVYTCKLSKCMFKKQGNNMATTNKHVHAYTHTRAGLPHQAGQRGEKSVTQLYPIMKLQLCPPL